MKTVKTVLTAVWALTAIVAQSAVIFSEGFDPAPALTGDALAEVPVEHARGEWLHTDAEIADIGGLNANVLRVNTETGGAGIGATRGAGIALAESVFSSGADTYELTFDVVTVSDPTGGYLDVQIWDAAAGSGEYQLDFVVNATDLLLVRSGTSEAVSQITNQTAITSTGSYALSFNYDGSDDVVLLFGSVRNADDGLVSYIDIDNVSMTSGAVLPNQPPAFSSDPISKSSATAGVTYTDSIAGDASDPDSDPMTFSLTSPYTWLTVATNGTLSGTPGAAHAGTNTFTVQVSADGGTDTATLEVVVNEETVEPPVAEVTIDFTAAEGYADGDVDDHPDWTALSANLVDVNADGYNGAKGTLTYDADTTWRDAIYDYPVYLDADGDSITFRTVFRFNSTGTVNSNAAVIIHTHSIYDALDTSAAELRTSLRRARYAVNEFDLYVRGEGDNNYSPGSISGDQIGLSTNGTGTSDWLDLTSTLTRSSVSNEWNLTAELMNLSNGSNLLSVTVTDLNSLPSYYEALTYYPGITSGNTEEDALSSDREIDLVGLDSAGGELPGNLPPVFAVERITKPVADLDTAYTNSIAGDASDPEGDAMTFSLIDAPDWLTIESDGLVHGTPTAGDEGPNEFTVQVSSTGGTDTTTLIIVVNEEPVLSDWDKFVDAHGLSGFKFDDFDADNMADAYEFAHGGNPTDPADQGTYFMEYEADNSVRFTSLELTNAEPGVSVAYTAEWAEGLLTNDWQQAWDTTTTAAAALDGYNEVERVLDGSTHEQLFVRNKAYNVGRPNILMIVCDDLGYADVGFGADLFGEKDGSTEAGKSYTSPYTPQIDSLARNGAILTQAYIPHPFCGPSRMGLLTGRYPHHFGGSKNLPYEVLDLPSQDVRDLWGYEGANELGIPTNETTIASVLQNAGYRTGAFGKWHCGVASNAHPNAVGFDYWYGMIGGGHNYYSDGWMSKDDPNVVNDYQFWLTRNGDEVPPPDVPAPGLYLTDMLTDDAVGFITNTPPEQPLFMYMCYNAPHAPLTAKVEDLIYLFGGTGQDDGSYTKQEESVAMMYGVDRGVSNLVASLKAEGRFDNTLIIFLSDNGGKEMAIENDADNGPFKGGKGDVHEGGVRSPMFIHYPNAIAPETLYEHPMYPYDLYPTFARLGEAAIPQDKVLSGKDIWDDILTDQDAHIGDTVFWVRHNAGANNVGMRNGDYKATRQNNGSWNLYDIINDISETVDIADGNEAIIADMLADSPAWTNDAVDPLWHDTETGYWQWETNNMPNYNESFSP
jgi:arylsulfatase A-like enzyme